MLRAVRLCRALRISPWGGHKKATLAWVALESLRICRAGLAGSDLTVVAGFDDLDKLLYVEGLGEGGDQVWILEVAGFIVEAGNDDELGLDVLPSGKEFEHHLAGEAWHFEVEQDDVELVVGV